jgi:hypothetical protein
VIERHPDVQRKHGLLRLTLAMTAGEPFNRKTYQPSQQPAEGACVGMRLGG